MSLSQRFFPRSNTQKEAISSRTQDPPLPQEPSRLQTLTEFKPFPRLPIELRLLIWGHATPASSTITESYNYGNPLTFTWKRASGIPAVLHACRESRYEYLDTSTSPLSPLQPSPPHRYQAAHAKYRLYFLEEEYIEDDEKHTVQGCFVSLDTDTLSLHRTQNCPLATIMRNVTIHYHIVDPAVTKDILLELAADYPALESLTLLIPHDYFRCRVGHRNAPKSPSFLSIEDVREIWERERSIPSYMSPKGETEWPSNTFFTIRFQSTGSCLPPRRMGTREQEDRVQQKPPGIPCVPAVKEKEVVYEELLDGRRALGGKIGTGGAQGGDRPYRHGDNKSTDEFMDAMDRRYGPAWL